MKNTKPKGGDKKVDQDYDRVVKTENGAETARSGANTDRSEDATPMKLMNRN